jgi:hypothetical protein
MFYAIAISSMLTAGVLNGDKAVAFITQAPTSEEIVKTLPKEQLKKRIDYVKAVKIGLHDMAKRDAQHQGLDIAMTAVEAMHKEPAPQPAKAEKPESGNVQSPPLN